MKKQLNRVLSVLLCITLFSGVFQLVNVNALPVAPQEETIPEVAGEIVELRQADAKVFATENPNVKIFASWGSPVHFKQNDEWVEYDNGLELSSRSLSASGRATYGPRANDMSVSIPQDLTDGQMITLSSNGYTVGFGVSAANRRLSHKRR